MTSVDVSHDSQVMPGNVLIDSMMKKLYGVEFDKDGLTVS